MNKKSVTNLDVLPVFKRIMIRAYSILDVGCGGTIYENNREHDWWNYFNCRKRVGIDIWPREIEWRRTHFPSDMFLVMDALDVDRCFPEDSFDIVHCQNVVEHFPKDKACELIRKMEAIAKKQVILGTPIGFRQNMAELREKNPFEEHKCVFTEKELENLGYTMTTIKNLYMIGFKVME